MLSVVFSLNANAESPKVPEYHLEILTTNDSIGYLTEIYEVDPFDSLKDWNFYEMNNFHPGGIFDTTTSISIYTDKTSDHLISKGNKATFTMYGVYFYNYFTINGGTYPSTVPDEVSATVYYIDGTVSYPNDVTYKKNGNILDISFSFTPKKDVEYITLWIRDDFNYSSSGNLYYKNIVGEYNNTDGYRIEVEQESEETGLIKSIINWIKDIFNSITDGFSAIGEGISNLFSKITEGFSNIGEWFAELPTKLWEVISEGLKALFVPSTDEITEYKDKWEELLSDRFGALYQSFNIIIDFASDLLSYITDDVTGFGNFTMPYVSLESIGIPFEFGGYSIRLTDIHPLFDDLMTMVRYFSDFIVTLLFVNGLRKKYDEVFGG